MLCYVTQPKIYKAYLLDAIIFALPRDIGKMITGDWIT